MNVVNKVRSTNDLERALTVLRSVDWVVPAYLPAGGLSAIAAMLEREPVSKREEILEWVLPGLYDEERLASMLLGCTTRPSMSTILRSKSRKPSKPGTPACTMRQWRR